MRFKSLVQRAAVLLTAMACLLARAPWAYAERPESVRSEADSSFSLLQAQATAFKLQATALMATHPVLLAGEVPSEFDETPVSIPSHGGWRLRGMLAVPRGAGPETPAVVLLHMSGEFAMDENIPARLTSDGKPGKLFKQLSDALARAGFVVLRYDKRGVRGWDAQTETENVDRKVFDRLSVEDLTKDGATAVRYLRNRLGAAGRRVLLLGHSEGTVIAPLVAKLEPVDGLILMGAVASSFDATFHYLFVERRVQLALQALDEDKDGFVSRWESARFYSDPLLDGVLFELRRFPEWDANQDGRLSAGEIEAAFETTMKEDRAFELPWYQSILALKPNLAVLPGFRGPVLILQGEQDTNTPASEARLLERALRDSRHPDFTVEILPGLGHAFSPPRGAFPTLGPLAPEALDFVTRWAERRFILKR